MIYIIYLIVSLYLTYFVGNHLYRNGIVWVDFLIGDTQLSIRINKILLLLYRLFNGGYIIYTLMNVSQPDSLNDSLSFLLTRVGLIAILLAYLHYQNIFLLLLFSHFKTSKS